MSAMPDVFFDSTGSWVVIEGQCRSHELSPDEARHLADLIMQTADEVESGEAATAVEEDRRTQLHLDQR